MFSATRRTAWHRTRRFSRPALLASATLLSGTLAAVGVGSSVAGAAGTAGVTIDKQVSANGGTTWQDVGDGVLNGPSVPVGSTVDERVIVVNTGTFAISDATVTDVNGPADFTFGGQSTVTVGVGQTLISDLASVVAVAGDQIDTATVTGTASGVTVSASDQANYVGVAATPDLRVSNSAPSSVPIGSGFAYTVNVTDSGTAIDSAVSLRDELPDDLGFRSVSTTQGVCTVRPFGPHGPFDPLGRPPMQLDRATVICELGTLGADETATVTISVIPMTPGTTTDTATATATNVTPDSDDFATATTTVLRHQPPPPLRLHHQRWVAGGRGQRGT